MYSSRKMPCHAAEQLERWIELTALEEPLSHPDVHRSRAGSPCRLHAVRTPSPRAAATLVLMAGAVQHIGSRQARAAGRLPRQQQQGARHAVGRPGALPFRVLLLAMTVVALAVAVVVSGKLLVYLLRRP